MPDVFVSYSRQDREFADRLTAALDARQKQAWLDTERIVDAEVFPKAIRAAIESAEAFLFVISPDAVASPFCEQEVAYAASLGKRIVPVLLIETPDTQIPAEIRERHWITFTDNVGFDRLMDRVVLALDTDLEHRGEHTRWLVKALEWDREQRDGSFLLRGAELSAAENWLAQSTEHVDPAPTSLQREYLLVSRRMSTRRQGRLVAASLIVAAISVGLVVVALLARGQANTATAVATSRALAAESENDLSIDPETSVLLGMRAVRESPTPDALFALREALDRSSVRLALPNMARRTCSNANVTATNGSEALYSPGGGQITEGSCAGDVMAVNASDGRVEWRRHLSTQVSAVAYSPDGRTLAVGTMGGVDMLDPTTGVKRRTFAGVEPTGLAFSPDGSQLADTTTSGVILWDLATGSSRNPFTFDLGGSDSPSYTPSERLVLPTFPDGAYVIDPANTITLSDTLMSVCGDEAAPQDGVAVSPTGAFVVCSEDAADGSARVTVWSATTLTEEYTLTAQASTGPAAVAVSRDGSLIAAGFQDGSGGIWSASTHAEIVPILGGTSLINSMSFSPDSRRLVVAFADGSARVYATGGPAMTSLRVAPDLNVAPLVLKHYQLTALIQQGDTRQTFSIGSCASPGCVVRSWSLSGHGAPRDLVLSENGAQLAWLSPDGDMAAVWEQTQTSNDKTYGETATSIWNINERKVVRTLPRLSVSSVGFSPDHRLVAATLYGRGVRVFDVSTGRETILRDAQSSCIGEGWMTPVFTNNDRMVADADGCGYVYVWNAQTGRRLLSLTNANAYAVAFDPSGAHLAIASNDDTATVVDVHTGRRVFELIGHTRALNDVAYSPDGRYIATVSVDQTVRIWDARTGIPLRTYIDPEAAYQASETDPLQQSADGVAQDVAGVNTLAFSPDGREVATENAARIVRVWDTCTACGNAAALLSLASHYVVNPLTPIERFESSASAIASSSIGNVGEASGSANGIANPFLGVSAVDVTPQQRQRFSLVPSSGALVYGVSAGSPAVSAGIKENDVIVALNGRAVRSALDLQDDVEAAVPGQSVTMAVYRGQQKLNVVATLTSTPLP